MRVALLSAEIPDYGIDFAEVAAGHNQVDYFIADRFRTEFLPRSPNLTVNWVHWPRQRQIVDGVFQIRRLAQRILAAQPDIVHILADNNMWCAALRPLLGSVPVVTTVHDADVHPGDTSSRLVPRFLVNDLRRRSSAVLVHGVHVRDQLLRNQPELTGRVHVFPHIPLMRFKRASDQFGFRSDTASNNVVFFGRILTYKGLSYLLDAAKAVREHVPDVKFIIAGSGNLEAYRAQIGQLDCVEVDNRFITFEAACKYFSEAGVVALPYIEASQSGVLMTALPYALPVVASDVGDIGATVRAMGCGPVVPPRDAEALSRALISVLAHPERRQDAVKNARAALATRYSTETLSAELTAIYKAVLARRDSRGGYAARQP